MVNMYTIITRDQCNFCDRAKAVLRSQKLQYTEYNVQSKSSRWLVPLLLKADLKTVPQIFDSEGKYVGGYTELENSLQK